MADAVFLGLEPRLITRLQDRLPVKLPALADALQVIPARSLAGVLENAQSTPSVQVYPGAYRPVDEQDRGAIQTIEQTWLVVIVVRNAADQLGGSAARADASEICEAVLSTLLAWSPGQPYSRLRLVAAPAAQWSKGGFGYYPIAFTTRLTVKGESTQPVGAYP